MGNALFKTAVLWWFPELRKPIDQSTVVQLLLNSAYIMLLKPYDVSISPPVSQKEEEVAAEDDASATLQQQRSKLKETTFVLEMEDFASPFFVEKYDCKLKVVFEVSKQQVVSFEYNDLVIEEPAEMLSILLHTNGTTAHPMMHSFHNQHYKRRSAVDSKFLDMFLHGQSLNYAAHYYTGLMFGCGPAWLKKVLAFNAEKPVPMHSLSSMKSILPYSRVGRFLVESRQAVFSLVRKYKVPVDPETWFVVSVMHSIDHFMPGHITSGRFMFHRQLPNQWYWTNMLAAVFYVPVQNEWCNNLLRMKRARNPFYQELYTKLRSIDHELADEVSLSLAY